MTFDKKTFIQNSIHALINEAQTHASFSLENQTIHEKKAHDCHSLEELHHLCENTLSLKSDLKNANLVFGKGNPKAELMIIGEAPGEEEDKQKEPFVGKSGKLLTQMINAIKLKREDVYIANVIKYRPKDNRTPNEKEISISLPFLLRQIEFINPKIILCLGKVATGALLKFKGPLNDKRGTVSYLKIKLNKYPVVVTYHPAALLYNPQWKRPTWEDLQYAKKKMIELSHPVNP